MLGSRFSWRYSSLMLGFFGKVMLPMRFHDALSSSSLASSRLPRSSLVRRLLLILRTLSWLLQPEAAGKTI